MPLNDSRMENAHIISYWTAFLHTSTDLASLLSMPKSPTCNNEECNQIYIHVQVGT